MHKRNGRAAREQRRAEAAERQAARDARSDQQQLHLLINNGHGHCKEATRLADTIGDTIHATVEGE
jgi:hypothetical protein